MKFAGLLAVLVLLAAPLCAQKEDVKAKHAAYYLCINTIEKNPHQAKEYCSAYLKKYPNDDARLVEFVKKWISAYGKISTYLKIFRDSENAARWMVYKPDLKKKIPIVSQEDSFHKVKISREFAASKEEKLLRKAEAVYPSFETISRDLFRGWRYLSEPQASLPSGEPKWWTGSFDTILSAQTVTTGAVIYYYDISRKLKENNHKIKENSFTFYRTELKYRSSIKKTGKYERSGKTFSNVYVADMNLTWGQVCGGLCGHGFTRNKVVVLDEDGAILDLFLDAAVNFTHWVS